MMNITTNALSDQFAFQVIEMESKNKYTFYCETQKEKSQVVGIISHSKFELDKSQDQAKKRSSSLPSKAKDAVKSPFSFSSPPSTEVGSSCPSATTTAVVAAIAATAAAAAAPAAAPSSLKRSQSPKSPLKETSSAPQSPLRDSETDQSSAKSISSAAVASASSLPLLQGEESPESLKKLVRQLRVENSLLKKQLGKVQRQLDEELQLKKSKEDSKKKKKKGSDCPDSLSISSKRSPSLDSYTL